MTSGSISFDRAAGYYDRTRVLPPEAATKVFAMLQKELSGRGRSIEIGVGTGRIALPLARAGIDLVGIDLSSKMLAKLVENAGGRSPFSLVEGDAARLPFRTGCFGAAIAAWVLHLVRDWHDVVGEIVRVVQPKGLILVDHGGPGQGPASEIRWHFRDEAGVDWPVGVADYAEVDRALSALGASARPLEPIEVDRRTTIEAEIASLEAGLYSVSWMADEATRKRAASATRVWAEERFGSLTETRDIPMLIEWKAYDLS